MKIHEGCLAIVIDGNPYNIGKIVRVGKFVGMIGVIEVEGNLVNCVGEDFWEVDKPITAISQATKHQQEFYFQREKNLSKIDEDDERLDEFYEIEEIIKAHS